MNRVLVEVFFLVKLTLSMSLNSLMSMFLTSQNKESVKEHLRSFRCSFDKDFILIFFLLLFGIETVIIGLWKCQLALWVCDFVGEYRGGRFY
jgi:hypothetical protein